MEKRILLELRGRKPEEVDELNLDNCKSPNMTGLTDEFCNLKVLSLNGAGLTTLKGFPCLPKLRKLELSDNRISSGLSALTQCSALTSLNLSGNHIKELSELKPLAQLKKLQKLDLFNCDVTNVDNYRKDMFEMLPDLVGLDGYDRTDAEVDDSDVEEDGNYIGDEELDEDSDSDDEDADDDGEIGLSAIYKDDLDDGEENDEDYEEGGEEEEDDDEIEDDEEHSDLNTSDKDGARGTKRKHDEEEKEDTV